MHANGIDYDATKTLYI